MTSQFILTRESSHSSSSGALTHTVAVVAEPISMVTLTSVGARDGDALAVATELGQRPA